MKAAVNALLAELVQARLLSSCKPRLVLEMLLSDMPDEGFKWGGDNTVEKQKNQHGELQYLGSAYGCHCTP